MPFVCHTISESHRRFLAPWEAEGRSLARLSATSPDAIPPSRVGPPRWNPGIRSAAARLPIAADAAVARTPAAHAVSKRGSKPAGDAPGPSSLVNPNRQSSSGTTSPRHPGTGVGLLELTGICRLSNDTSGGQTGAGQWRWAYTDAVFMIGFIFMMAYRCRQPHVRSSLMPLLRKI